MGSNFMDVVVLFANSCFIASLVNFCTETKVQEVLKDKFSFVASTRPYLKYS